MEMMIQKFYGAEITKYEATEMGYNTFPMEYFSLFHILRFREISAKLVQ